MTLRLWGPRARLGLIVLAVTFLLDQAVKTWLLFRLAAGTGVPISGPYDLRAAADLGYMMRGPEAWTPFLDIVMAWNLGVSYGLFPMESSAGQLGLAAFKIAAAIGLWLWLARTTDSLTAVALGLIAGGALGNALDRLLYEGVADFFSLHLRAIGSSFHWYVFNIADVAIVAGVGALLYESAVPRRPTPARTRDGDVQT